MFIELSSEHETDTVVRFFSSGERSDSSGDSDTEHGPWEKNMC